ncbi:MAG: hypothetical protein HYY24_09495 [Verrucomicrobia bacterium]|nr:hypothetical protein [Verrucomicrobiota bacterium]
MRSLPADDSFRLRLGTALQCRQEPFHRCIIVSDPEQNGGYIVLVRITTDSGRWRDRDCILTPADWSELDHGSAVAYSTALCGRVELGKQLGMVPAHKRLDFDFSSGSMDLHVLLHPVTFEKVSVNRHNPNFKASSLQKQRVERLNKFADRFSVHLSHALLLELDLMEVDPPQRSLKQHFDELKRHTEMLRKQFTVP